MPDGIRDLTGMSDRDILMQMAGELPYIRRDIQDTKSFVEQHINMLNEALSNCNKEHQSALEDIDKDIEDLKSWKDKVNGALGIISLFVGGLVVTILGKIAKLF